MRDFRGNFGRQFGTEDEKGGRRKRKERKEKRRASQTETGIIREGGVGQRRE